MVLRLEPTLRVLFILMIGSNLISDPIGDYELCILNMKTKPLSEFIGCSRVTNNVIPVARNSGRMTLATSNVLSN